MMLTAGTAGVGGITVIVAVAEVLFPSAVAVAVYVVVVVGLTVCVPPFGWSVYLLPSVPATITCVAFAAVTFSVAEPPEAIETGLAVMLIVSVAGNLDILLGALPAHPVIRIGEEIQNNSTTKY